MWFGFVSAIFAAATSASPLQSVPRAIYTDPPADARHPARLTALKVPSHGVSFNGLICQPSGEGRHPTLIINWLESRHQR